MRNFCHANSLWARIPPCDGRTKSEGTWRIGGLLRVNSPAGSRPATRDSTVRWGDTLLGGPSKPPSVWPGKWAPPWSTYSTRTPVGRRTNHRRPPRMLLAWPLKHLSGWGQRTNSAGLRHICRENLVGQGGRSRRQGGLRHGRPVVSEGVSAIAIRRRGHGCLQHVSRSGGGYGLGAR